MVAVDSLKTDRFPAGKIAVPRGISTIRRRARAHGCVYEYASKISQAGTGMRVRWRRFLSQLRTSSRSDNRRPPEAALSKNSQYGVNRTVRAGKNPAFPGPPVIAPSNGDYRVLTNEF
jgi:hypothetical protein